MEELKRKAMRALRWLTAGAQMLWIELAKWLKNYWFALLVGIVIGLML